MARIKVSGENREHGVVLYGLTTCTPCKKTLAFLKSRGVEYEYMNLDAVDAEERGEAMMEIADYLPGRGVALAYPIIIIDDLICLVGFSESKLTKVLGL